MGKTEGGEDFLSPGAVAKIFGVDTKTITRWANEGKLPFRRTLGGHRRFPLADIIRIAKES